ncbi:hypothetical protein C8R43DRAFT_951859 [Mycena crocata]|nr:hypothetical protein C8R43DRAFT_965885 [Mycena crocata]KAJ7149901.1 hypothetical protein C8R43DRAFT_951859 [Mycena crocata]
MPSPPPAYAAADIDALSHSLSGLSVGNPSSVSPRSSTPPPSANLLPPVTPRRQTRLYEIHSPNLCGVTSEWSQAAALTQGIPQAQARSISSPRKPRRKKGAIVVFYGRRPGTYATWNGPAGAEMQVRQVSGALFQGYETAAEAEAAYQYAEAHRWTGVRGSGALPPPNSLASAIPALPLPLDPTAPIHNPLHGAVGAPIHTWYIVYAGITPGIYLSQ